MFILTLSTACFKEVETGATKDLENCELFQKPLIWNIPQVKMFIGFLKKSSIMIWSKRIIFERLICLRARMVEVIIFRNT